MPEANLSYQKIIDISQPVTQKTACFPGDVPFSKQVTLSYAQSNVINLTALTMSPHVGSHADAPVHIKGDLGDPHCGVGDMPLAPFIGPCTVIDIAQTREPISRALVGKKLEAAIKQAPRVLFKTLHKIDYDTFEEEYAYIADDCATILGELGFCLVGLDTPSVDHVKAKNLTTHHILDKGGLVWLENLDLTQVEEGLYQLIALPLKFMELEASPLRAVLLK